MKTRTVGVVLFVFVAVCGCQQNQSTGLNGSGISGETQKPEIERFLRLDEFLRDPDGFNTYFQITGSVKYSVTHDRAMTPTSWSVHTTLEAAVIPQDTDTKPIKLFSSSTDEVVFDEQRNTALDKTYPLDEIRSGLVLHIKYQVRGNTLSIVSMQLEVVTMQ